MHFKIHHYQPRRGRRTFTTRTERSGCMQVQEWKYLSPAIAEEVLEVELSVDRYSRITMSQHGDECQAQRVIVAEARRRRERSPFPHPHLPYLLSRYMAHPADPAPDRHPVGVRHDGVRRAVPHGQLGQERV